MEQSERNKLIEQAEKIALLEPDLRHELIEKFREENLPENFRLTPLDVFFIDRSTLLSITNVRITGIDSFFICCSSEQFDYPSPYIKQYYFQHSHNVTSTLLSGEIVLILPSI